MGIIHRQSPRREARPDIVAALKLIYELDQIHDFKLLTTEATLLYLVKTNPGKNIKYYMIESGISSKWFHFSLNKLLDAKLVVKTSSHADRRIKILF